MPSVAEVCQFLHALFPPALAEDWDNIGLLVGREDRDVQRMMTCLTVTPSSAAEAVSKRAELIVAHHPIPFRPLKRIIAQTTVGRLLLQLIEGGVAVFSPHTAFDSSSDGINAWLSEIVGIADPKPLVPHPEAALLGSGRWGDLYETTTLNDVALRLKLALGQGRIQIVGHPDCDIQRAAVGCGSAGELLEVAMRMRCQLFVTGETSFHTCLEAEANNITLMLVGHYASERFGVERLALKLSDAFPDVTVWASEHERDPLTWI